jgi:hypothetical protein
MTGTSLTRWSGLSLLAAGIANAAFWVMVIPIGTFAGAQASLHVLWLPSQLLHVVAGMLALFGLVGLYARYAEEVGWPGLASFALSLFGTGFYLADVVIALMVFPIAARLAPVMLAADGVLNLSPIYIVFAVVFMVGYILLGLVFLLRNIYPRPAVALFVLGAILMNLPPVLPMTVLVAGGVLWGAGVAWLGIVLWSEKPGQQA